MPTYTQKQNVLMPDSFYTTVLQLMTHRLFAAGGRWGAVIRISPFFLFCFNLARARVLNWCV